MTGCEVKGKYELAIFDLDGVLTATSEQHYQAWKVLAKELNIPFDRDVNELLKGISRMESLEIILKSGGKNQCYSEAEKISLTYRKNEIYKRMIRYFSPDNLFHGVRPLFEFLKEQGIKIALASASNNAPHLLKCMKIDESFDVVVNPSSIAKGKPDPEIFLTAAKHLGVNPEICIGFEDAIAGVKAIKSAGMFAVGIGDSTSLSEADVIIDHIANLDYLILT